MEEKVYTVIGINEEVNNEPIMIMMGRQKAYTSLEKAQKELEKILNEIDEDGFEYEAEYGEDKKSLHITFETGAMEDYFIYELEIE